MDKPDEPLLVNIRKAGPADLAFAFDTWRHSYKHQKPLTWDDKTYNLFMSDRMRRLHKRATILVATFVDYDDDLVGWVCAEPPLLHYVFVKKIYQNQGVARQLIAAAGFPQDAPVFCTHWTFKNNVVKLPHITFLNCEV